MTTASTVLSIDLGAESGRVMAVHHDGKGLKVKELHRFTNRPVSVRETLYWDFLGLWAEIQAGIAKGKALVPASLGINTWGFDFGLLASDGSLLGNPVHYRDTRTEGMMEAVFARIPKCEVFAQTGIQLMRINTMYQMMSLVTNHSPLLSTAETFLTSSDLINYWLTGERVCEFTIATTTQMFNPRSGGWAVEMLDRLDIPTRIFPPIVSPGTRLGTYDGIEVIAPACHDTASAVAAVPARTANYAYISSGTWSLIGLEVEAPVISDAAMEANVTNEGGVFDTFRLLTNATGLWIIQQCRETWRKAGRAYNYSAMVEMARASPPLLAFIDPDDPILVAPGDHPAHIRSICKRTGQSVPQNEAGVIRCVFESLALKYRSVIERLVNLTGRTVDVIHIIGGGSQNQLLCQMTANATGRVVVAGPTEATVIGNALVQLITLGELKDLRQARDLVAQMEALQSFDPSDREAWKNAYQRFLALWGHHFVGR